MTKLMACTTFKCDGMIGTVQVDGRHADSGLRKHALTCNCDLLGEARRGLRARAGEGGGGGGGTCFDRHIRILKYWYVRTTQIGSAS